MLGVEGYRYYFMTDVTPGTDGAISFDRMEQVYNADLANSGATHLAFDQHERQVL